MISQVAVNPERGSGAGPEEDAGRERPEQRLPGSALQRRRCRRAAYDEVDTDLVGYRGPTACAAAGITYRQLDYWARTGLVAPSVRSATGSGTQRLYSFRDILVLKVVKRLLDTGVSLQHIRFAVDQLRERGMETWRRSP